MRVPRGEDEDLQLHQLPHVSAANCPLRTSVRARWER